MKIPGFKVLKEYWLKIFMLTFFVVGVIGSLSSIFASPSQSAQKSAAILEISGAIGPAVQDFVHRGIENAVKQNDQVIIFQIDTPGGLSKSMRGIIKDILKSPIPVISYVAPSGARAASAGTYLLYASHIAAMAPGTNLGAATPVQIGTPGRSNGKQDKKKPKELTASQKKAINDAKAYIRSLAQLRGRNVKWAEKAVTHGESLSAKEALKINVINVIANNVPELLKKINGRRVIVQGKSEILKTAGLTFRQILPDWRTKFLAVITDPSVAYILLMIGFYGLFFEFVNPGFIIPGVAGAICLLIALYAFQLLPINYAGLGLILLGLAFIVAEAFMPSFGALGIGGIIAFLIGSIMLIRTDAVGFTLPLKLIIGVTVATGLFFLGLLSLAFRSHRRQVVSGLENLLGREGIIELQQNKLWVRIEGELWQVNSVKKLEPGQAVKVVAVKGLVLEVIPVSNSSIGENQ